MKAKIRTHQIFKAMYTSDDVPHETQGFILDIPLDFDPEYEDNLSIYCSSTAAWFSIREILTIND